MEEERIRKDIELFERHVQELESTNLVDMATRYYQDAGYYLHKKDLFTAFGCINYAHGLIDALRLAKSERQGDKICTK